MHCVVWSVLALWSPNDYLSDIKCLSVAGRRATLHPPQSQESAKYILREPLLMLLGCEVVKDVFDLESANAFVQADERVRRSNVSVVFGNLILENEMITKRIPCQIGDHAMILVQIVAIVSEDDIRRHLML